MTSNNTPLTPQLKWLGILLFAIVVLLLSACQKPAESTDETISADTHTIYLVRHAEKQKGDNPELTMDGQARAQILADKLMDKGVTRIHSSNYNRTRQTAMPLAKALGLDVEIYDPRDLPAMADKLRATPGVHLVVGHSNTTPELAALLTVHDMDPMTETEYDRLIKVTLGANDAADFNISKYGKATFTYAYWIETAGVRSEKEPVKSAEDMLKILTGNEDVGLGLVARPGVILNIFETSETGTALVDFQSSKNTQKTSYGNVPSGKFDEIIRAFLSEDHAAIRASLSGYEM